MNKIKSPDEIDYMDSLEEKLESLIRWRFSNVPKPSESRMTYYVERLIEPYYQASQVIRKSKNAFDVVPESPYNLTAEWMDLEPDFVLYLLPSALIYSLNREFVYSQYDQLLMSNLAPIYPFHFGRSFEHCSFSQMRVISDVNRFLSLRPWLAEEGKRYLAKFWGHIPSFVFPEGRDWPPPEYVFEQSTRD